MRKILVALMLVWAGYARADAVLAGSDGTRHYPTADDVSIDVRAQIELTTIVFTFDPIAASGDYTLTVPMPERGYVVGVDLDRGSGWQQAPMATEAPPPALGGSPVAEDPQVKGWLGYDSLRADFAALPAGPLRVRVKFERILRRHLGEVDFTIADRRFPLRDTSDPGAQVTLHFALATFRDLSLFDAQGPSATIAQTARGATLDATGTGGLVYAMRYAEVPNGIDVHTLAYRTGTSDPLGSTDGYYLIVLDADDSTPPPPRAISLIVDESGSMDGDKIAQARAAALAMLDELRPIDSFQLVAFESNVHPFGGGLVPATADNLAAARTFIDGIAAGGGTNIDGALQAALSGVSPAPGRFDAVILLTDGQATEGVTDDGTIHDDVLRYDASEARLFTFAVGSDADVPLLEGLARSTRGRCVRLSDAEAAEQLADRAKELFQDIDAPRLVDVTVSIDGIGANRPVPDPVPDVFGGEQQLLLGRYSTPGTGVVHVRGTADGQPFAADVPIAAPAIDTTDDRIAWAWATETVGELLGEIGSGGDLATIQQQIIQLGLGYRIQTPWTTYVSPPTGGPPPDTSGGGYTPSGGWSSGGGVPDGSGLPLLLLGLAIWARRCAR